MLPLVTIGPLHLSSYALLYGVAIVAAGMLAFHRLLRTGAPPGQIASGLALTILAGVVGAVLGLAIASRIWGLAPGSGTLLALRHGSTILGALAFGGLTGLAYCRWRGLPAGTLFDAGIVALPLGQAIGRIGCLLAGCCFGTPTTSWLAMNLPDEAGRWAPRYPTQLLSSAADLAIFLLLLALSRPARAGAGAGPLRFPGSLTILYGALYFSKRLGMEVLRGDNAVVLGPLTWPQVVSLAGLAVAAALFLGNLAAARARTKGPA